MYVVEVETKMRLVCEIEHCLIFLLFICLSHCSCGDVRIPRSSDCEESDQRSTQGRGRCQIWTPSNKVCTVPALLSNEMNVPLTHRYVEIMIPYHG